MAKKKKQMIIHLEREKNHFYFHSISQMCRIFAPELIGISRNALYNFQLSPGHPYVNKAKDVIIRKNVIL